MRGGTSKCWVFEAHELPVGRSGRERVLSAAYGGADPRQINGIGGGTSTTSKAIVIEAVDRTARQVDYSFAQVSIDRERVEWSSNCGNCATAVALYAVQSGAVEPTGDWTTLSIRNIQTGLLLDADVATPGGRSTNLFGASDDPAAAGVPVDLLFRPPTWTTFGALLPTGNAIDVLESGGRRIRATLIDAGAPAVLADAADLGLTGSETVAQLSRHIGDFASLRAAAAVRMGLPADGLAVPKVGVVAPPAAADHDLACRMISMTAPHPSIGLTSAVAVAAAAGVSGSVLQGLVPGLAAANDVRALRIGTASGVTTVEVQLPGPSAVRIKRSARRLVNGSVFVPMETIPAQASSPETHPDTTILEDESEGARQSEPVKK